MWYNCISIRLFKDDEIELYNWDEIEDYIIPFLVRLCKSFKIDTRNQFLNYITVFRTKGGYVTKYNIEEFLKIENISDIFYIEIYLDYTVIKKGFDINNKMWWFILKLISVYYYCYWINIIRR